MFDDSRPQFYYSRFTEKEQRGIKAKKFYISDIQFFDNGNTHLLFDSKYVTYSSPSAGIYTPDYFYNELISCTFNQEGDFIKANILERKNFRALYNAAGYSIVAWNNSIFLFFDSNISKNRAKKLGLDVGSVNLHTVTELIQINDTGNIIKEKLLWNTKESSFYFEDILAKKIGDKILIGGKIFPVTGSLMLALRRMKFRFGFIELKDLSD